MDPLAAYKSVVLCVVMLRVAALLAVLFGYEFEFDAIVDVCIDGGAADEWIGTAPADDADAFLIDAMIDQKIPDGFSAQARE